MVEVLPNFARPLESLEAGHGWFGTPQGLTLAIFQISFQFQVGMARVDLCEMGIG